MSEIVFWNPPKTYDSISKFIESTTDFKGVPCLYHGDFKNDAEIKSFIDKIDEKYKGLVLGDFDKNRIIKRDNRADILHWCNVWKIFKERRPNCEVVNLGMPDIPFYDGDGDNFKKRVDLAINNDCGIPNWILREFMGGGSVSTYNIYPQLSKKEELKFTGLKTKERNQALIEVLSKCFPNKPKVINFWHRQSNGKNKFTLLDFREMWDNQIKPFIHLDGFTLGWYGIFREIHFRQSTEDRELFFKNTKIEHKDGEVNIHDKDQCIGHYIRQFVRLAHKLQNTVKTYKEKLNA